MVTKPGIAERVLSAEVAINNAINNSEIATYMEDLGIDIDELNMGLRFTEEARDAINVQKSEYGDQFEATGKLKECWEKADKKYIRTLKICWIVFKNQKGTNSTLMLRGPRKQSFPRWVDQAEALYVNLLRKEHLLAQMAKFYDRDELEAEYRLVQEAKEANIIQEAEKGEAQDATKARNAKLDQLDLWMADFRAFAKIALEEQPQLLEKLGFGSVK